MCKKDEKLTDSDIKKIFEDYDKLYAAEIEKCEKDPNRTWTIKCKLTIEELTAWFPEEMKNILGENN